MIGRISESTSGITLRHRSIRMLNKKIGERFVSILWRTSLIDLLSLCFSPSQRSHWDFINARQGIVLLVSCSRGEWQAPLLTNFQLLSHCLPSRSQKMVAYLLLKSEFLSQVLTSVPWPVMGTYADAGNGALDPDSSPDVANDSYDGSPSRSKRQTTPSEWPTSPEQTHIPVSPSHEVVDQLLISPPSTPPLLTQERVVRLSTSVPEPAGDRDPQATPEAVQQARLTYLRPSVPAQKRSQSVPLPSSSSAVPSDITNPRHKAASLPTDVFGSTMSHTRRVPPPSAKITKEPCGEVLVPGSDSGGPDTQSTQNNPSPSQRRVAIPARPERVNASLRMSSSPERVNEAHDAQSSVLEPGPSQEPDKGHLDELSRMALNGSYADHVHGNGVQTHNGKGDNRRNAMVPGLPSPEPELSYEQLPPSSLPVYSQTLDGNSSTVAVEETSVLERTPSQVTTQYLPTSITKRARPPTPSPPRGKRPRLMSREPVNHSREVHSAALRKVFDPELLKVGIEVDLTDYDGNPPLYPRKEEMSRLNLKQLDNPLLITNSKLAEIWKSVCKYRGWCGTQSGDNLSKVSS
jgi:hypothetical protein